LPTVLNGANQIFFELFQFYFQLADFLSDAIWQTDVGYENGSLEAVGNVFL